MKNIPKRQTGTSGPFVHTHGDALSRPPQGWSQMEWKLAGGKGIRIWIAVSLSCEL